MEGKSAYRGAMIASTRRDYRLVVTSDEEEGRDGHCNRRADHHRARGSAGRAGERFERHACRLRSRALAAALELGQLGGVLRGGRLRGIDTELARRSRDG